MSVWPSDRIEEKPQKTAIKDLIKISDMRFFTKLLDASTCFFGLIACFIQYSDSILVNLFILIFSLHSSVNVLQLPLFSLVALSMNLLSLMMCPILLF